MPKNRYYERFVPESGSSRTHPAADPDLNFGSTDSIADMADRVNHRWFAQLLSQPANEDLNELGVIFVCVLPDALAQLSAREHAAGLAHQDLQQHQFAWRKLEPLRAAVNIVRCQIEREIAYPQLHYWLLRIPAAKRANARQQFADGKGLGQIIVGSELQTSYPVVDSAACGQQQYTAGEMLRPQASQHFEPVDSRQAHVEHNQVEWVFGCLVQRGFASVNSFRIVTILGQCRGDLPGYGNFIFNNQDSHSLNGNNFRGRGCTLRCPQRTMRERLR